MRTEEHTESEINADDFVALDADQCERANRGWWGCVSLIVAIMIVEKVKNIYKRTVLTTDRMVVGIKKHSEFEPVRSFDILILCLGDRNRIENNH